MDYDQIRDCEHGRLKGRCEMCDLQKEVEELKKSLKDVIEVCAMACEKDNSQAMDWTGASKPGHYFARKIRAIANT